MKKKSKIPLTLFDKLNNLIQKNNRDQSPEPDNLDVLFASINIRRNEKVKLVNLFIKLRIKGQRFLKFKKKTTNRLIVLIPFYNAKNIIKKSYLSVLEQDYTNFRLIFINDCSTDGTVETLPADSARIITLSSPKRENELKNIYKTLLKFKLNEEDIIVVLKCGDVFANPKVFEEINLLYNSRKCLITYGQYWTKNTNLDSWKPYTKDAFDHLLSLNSRAALLKTFRYSLYKEFIQQDDFNLNLYEHAYGDYYTLTYDISLMWPLLKIAGTENALLTNVPSC